MLRKENFRSTVNQFQYKINTNFQNLYIAINAKRLVELLKISQQKSYILF